MFHIFYRFRVDDVSLHSLKIQLLLFFFVFFILSFFAFFSFFFIFVFAFFRLTSVSLRTCLSPLHRLSFVSLPPLVGPVFRLSFTSLSSLFRLSLVSRRPSLSPLLRLLFISLPPLFGLSIRPSLSPLCCLSLVSLPSLFSLSSPFSSTYPSPIFRFSSVSHEHIVSHRLQPLALLESCAAISACLRGAQTWQHAVVCSRHLLCNGSVT